MFELAGYEGLRPLHRSAGSAVYRATRSADARSVVLKVLDEEFPSPERIASFKREFEVTRLLRSAATVEALELQRLGRRWVMVLEDFGGESLRAQGLAGKLDLRSFLELAIALARAVEALHRHRLIHKDLTPGNIIYNRTSRSLKIIDFGISSLLDREERSFSSPEHIEGTLSYISPEQTGRINRAVDQRSDLYSLGVLLYELWLGRLPFRESDPLTLVHCHIAKRPLAPIAVEARTPQVLSDLLLKLLAKDADARYQTARGLAADLERLLQLHSESPAARLPIFPLGQRDHAGTLVLSQRLYGRQEELSALLAAYDQVAAGRSSLLLVSGYSGVGKSALVREIYRPVTAARGFFLSGKYDQLQRAVPYTAFLQAFRSLLSQILTYSEAEVARWQQRLKAALGQSGQVIVDVLPELGHIIGPQPEVPRLAGREASNRFHVVFQQFIAAFAAAEHPLTLFLDDLQWADEASLSLLEVLVTSSGSQHTLIVGAYRENEVHAAHPLALLLRELQGKGHSPQELKLRPLHCSEVEHWVADSLKISLETAAPLAALLFQKTQGNPFFLAEFLKSLCGSGLLCFDPEASTWRWDLPGIESLTATANVTELMIGKVQRLPKATEHALRLAAALGNRVSLRTLARLLGESERAVALTVWPAVIEGLVAPIGDDYKLLEVEEPGLQDSVQVEYKFAHDRVQQAAYSLIPELERPAVHRHIGQTLLRQAAAELRPEELFQIVNHLNAGQALLRSPAEREELHRLNHRASAAAQATIAFGPAFSYQLQAIALRIGAPATAAEAARAALPEDPELIATLYAEAAELAYLSTNFDALETLAAIALSLTPDPLRLARVYEVKIRACFAQGRPRESIAAGIEILGRLGCPLPAEPGPADIGAGLARVAAALRDTPVEALLDLPRMVDPSKLLVMRILTGLIPAAFIALPPLFPVLVLTQVELSIMHGNAPQSPVAYVSYGLILCGVIGDIPTGYRFGELADRLLQKLDTRERSAMTTAIVQCGTRHWKESIASTQAVLPRAYQAGVDTGDLEYAAIALEIYCYNAYFIGRELTQSERELYGYSQAMRHIRQERVYQLNEVYRQAMLGLLGRSADPCVLSGEAGSEEAWLARHQAANDQSGLAELYLHKLILLNYFGRFAEAAPWSERAGACMGALPGFVHNAVYCFHDSLAQLGRLPDVAADERPALLARVAENQGKLQVWAEHAPMNQAHRFCLIEAERARIAGEVERAESELAKSIGLAQKYGFPHEEGLAHERAALFYEQQGNAKAAAAQRMEARYAYQQWGAMAKVADLDRRYGTSEPTSSGAVGDFASSTVTLVSSTGTSLNVDLEAILRASRALSSEVALDALLRRILEVVLQTAGAERGVLILQEQGAWLVQAEGSVQSSTIEVLQRTPLAPAGDGSREESLPLSILQYVQRTRQVLVLRDAAQEGDFCTADYVVRRQARSILVVPLLSQAKLSGLLYLENHSAAGTFNGARIELLRILTAQATISIENARLYAGLQALTEAQRRFVPYQFLQSLSHADIAKVQLGDHVAKRMTTLFCDLRGFTRISERLGPRRVIALLNRYFAAMEPAIVQHGGFIDSFNGDEIMALFDVRVDQALQAATAMRQALAQFNEREVAAGELALKAGAGLNTGDVILGTVGGRDRIKCGVVGDCVNLASRIEQLTKRYDAAVLLGEETYNDLEDPSQFSFRVVDRVAVRGKERPITVYELLDAESGDRRARREAGRAALHEAQQLYGAREFATALATFHELAGADPEDPVPALFAARCRHYLAEPPPADWAAYERLSEK